MSHELIHKADEQQYEMHVDGHVAKVKYTRDGNIVRLTSTRVPEKIGGKGVGSELVKAVLEDLKSRKLKVDPVCWFVEHYINKHPEWKEMLN